MKLIINSHIALVIGPFSVLIARNNNKKISFIELELGNRSTIVYSR